MVKVVIVNGMPESGKTTFQEICVKKLTEHNWNTVIKSSVEWVKDIATYCGWNGEKTDKNRKFLSDLKKVLTDWDDAVLKNLASAIDYYHYTSLDYVVFIDIREASEIEKAKKAFNAISVIVRRPQVECNVYNNSSDMYVFEANYDFTVWNDSNIENLEVESYNFIKDAILDNNNNIYIPKEN